MGLNRILTSGNAALSVTAFLGSTIADIPTLEGVPLGTVDGTATGEVAAKVMVVGGSLTPASALYPVPPVVSTYSPTQFSNLGEDATLNVKASAGNVFSLACHNKNEADRYVQLHNTATVPTSGVTVPVFTFLVPAGSQIIIGTDFFTNAGCHFATGIAFAFSTTIDVYTAATASEHSTWVQYK